jgi:hypothetical protein
MSFASTYQDESGQLVVTPLSQTGSVFVCRAPWPASCSTNRGGPRPRRAREATVSPFQRVAMLSRGTRIGAGLDGNVDRARMTTARMGLIGLAAIVIAAVATLAIPLRTWRTGRMPLPAAPAFARGLGVIR